MAILPPVADNIVQTVSNPQLPSLENLRPGGPARISVVGARPSGKVGDIAFFGRDGKYQWLRNARSVSMPNDFELAWGLRRWNWPEYIKPDVDAVSTEVPGHFRMAVLCRRQSKGRLC